MYVYQHVVTFEATIACFALFDRSIAKVLTLAIGEGEGLHFNISSNAIHPIPDIDILTSTLLLVRRGWQAAGSR